MIEHLPLHYKSAYPYRTEVEAFQYGTQWPRIFIKLGYHMVEDTCTGPCDALMTC